MTNPMKIEKLKKAYKELSVAVIKVAVQDYKRKTHWSKDAYFFIENIKKSLFWDILNADDVEIKLIEENTGIEIRR